MNRRDALKAVLISLVPMRATAAPVVSTIIGTGSAGYSDAQVNNPYGVVVPDGGLWFCDLDNQRIRRLDLRRTGHDRRRERARGRMRATAVRRPRRR